MRWQGPARAALLVVVSAGTGLITNILTSATSAALIAGFVVLVSFGAAIAWWDRREGSIGYRTVVKEYATRNSKISGGTIKANEGADVDERADDHAVIRNTTTTAKGATVKRRAKRGKISNRRIDAS